MDVRKVKDRLQEVRDLLKDPSHWTKGVTACDEQGFAVFPDASSAVCWCLMGAIEKVENNDFEKARRIIGYLNRFVPPGHPGHSNIVEFNDYDETTHEDVMNLLDRAIQG